ncbi:extracellular solute-binding protein [Paenibacillus psychroresistens]|uniref:Extracellular solute-binding protein n=1 Tax=Paenibacillus psychroresistens TaxID=1778678 RepID=A0A6B8RSI6_9BACL|nr:extracellular solute-binding protein [Paenibacillus psychroresistens]QGQ99390.1 extracellular solute-binding protein [Paenibacillus psychroresistens]
MIKRFIFLVSLLLIAGLVLNGCDKAETISATATPTTTLNQDPPATEEPPNAVKLTLRHSLIKDSSANSLKIVEAAAAATEFEMPKLEIELEGVDENINRSTQLKAEMAAGTQPDIFELFGGKADAIVYAQAGKLLDLTAILTEIEKQYDFANLEDFTVDGKIIGLPITGQANGVFYNKKIFAELGVQPPLTYEDFIEICAKAQAKGITPLALASSDAWVPTLLFNSLLVRNTGPAVPGYFTIGDAKWTDPEVVNAFVQFAELAAKGYFSAGNQGFKYSDQQKQFKAGSAAMMYDGSWAYASLIDPNTSKIADDVGFFSFPDRGGPGDGLINASFSQGYGFSADLSEEQQEVVKLWIKNLFNDEIQKKQLTEDGVFPSMFFLDNTGVPSVVTEIITSVKSSAGTFASLDTLVQKTVMAELEAGLQQLLENKITVAKLTEKLQMIQVEANVGP